MKKALVLCGGGSLGSYEVGVWKYFQEKGITFDLVTGTSIGSLIGALVVQNDFEKCLDLWQKITVDDVMVNGMNIGKQLFKGMDVSKTFAFARTYFKNSGADIAPFKNLLAEYIDPKKVKESKMPLGIVTTSYPRMKQVNKISYDMKEEEIIPYLIASASCWPIFPIHKIGNKRYVDGGYTDNLPIDLAIKMGATNIVAVLLSAFPAVPQHSELLELPFVKKIQATHDLGFMMNFDHQTLMNNMKLGYLDAKKAYHEVLGYRFAFTSLDAFSDFASDFAREAIKDDPLLWKSIRKDLLSRGYDCKISEEVLIATLEIIGMMLEVSPYEEYSIESFFEACKIRCLELIKNDKGISKIRATKSPRALPKVEEPSFISYVYNDFKTGHKASHAKHFFKRSPCTLLITTLVKKFVEREKNLIN